jgi:hypothetical protein
MNWFFYLYLNPFPITRWYWNEFLVWIDFGFLVIAGRRK